MSGSMTREDFDAYRFPVLPRAVYSGQSGGLPRLGPAGERVYRYGGRHRSERPGHAHPALAQALQDQLAKLWHIGNGYTNEPVLQLAKPSCSRPLPTRCFSATPAPKPTRRPLSWRGNMPTISLAVKSEIIAFNHAFHGRTLFTVSVGGQPKYSSDYAPLPQGITHLPYNDIEAVTAAISSRTCAVIVEPIIGEGG